MICEIEEMIGWVKRKSQENEDGAHIFEIKRNKAVGDAIIAALRRLEKLEGVKHGTRNNV